MAEAMTVTLIGGPLDGMVLPDQPVTDDLGAYMVVPGETHRAVYRPQLNGPADRWHYGGQIA